MMTLIPILAIAASKGWSLQQMDVKSVFLHGNLKEEVYITPPSGLFYAPSSGVCKLKRSLYGLKKALRNWFDKFRSTLISFSFVQSWFMFLGTSLIAWKSKKQDQVFKSSTESEYRAMSSTYSEIV
ncbi:hypothetical protein L6164_026335 [Bauhinia variegata]|uniref:Uncharacterized protein n=1 Tax=Bauhinia variegata TaxID=167791 RepID=A0ACB9LQ80_BAUVA|nr:hypothetical protein L6164_026335 [Bauhinia variegata]